MTEVVRVVRPAELEHLGLHHAVVEASAGTGKTYLLEHLVVDLLLRRGAELDQILVVTFTEKATAELVQRVRAKLTELKDLGPDHPLARQGAAAAPEACWVLDDRARQILRRAVLSFDRASITTIHGFCQRLLAEHAFLNQRLFDEEVVDEGDAFHGAFLECLRRDAAPDPAVAPYLQAWLAAGNGLRKLELRLLRSTHQQAGPLGVDRPGPPARLRPARFDEAALTAALRGWIPVAPDDKALCEAQKKAKIHHSTAAATVRKLGALSELVAAWQQHQSLPFFLAGLDELERKWDEKGLAAFLPELARAAAAPAMAPVARACAALDAAAVPLGAALVHRLLPRLQARLESRKREAGRFDFQDMLALVARGLDGDGPRARALLASLRARFRHGLIDEFQDTDEVQWSIFRRIFLDAGPGPGHVLTVIGDPKQAIYGFRGADVHTYLRACTELRGDAPPLYLTACYRSTAPLVEAFNAILDQGAGDPFFRRDGGIHYDHPVVCGRPDLALLDAAGAPVAPVVVLDVASQQAGLLTWQVKQALLARMVEQIQGLLADRGGLRLRGAEGLRPVRARDIYVLTRTTRESREVGDALREASVPFAFFKQERLFDTVEAGEVLDVLRAIADPDDHTLRARAWITAFFGLTLPELAACESLPPGHPLERLLYEWRGLCDAGQLEVLFARLVQDSGLICRELFLQQSERRLTNYLHVLEILQEEAARGRATIHDLVLTLAAYVSGARKPPGLGTDIQRLETDAQAVQIMTIHHAKGLEAAVVFVYGGFWEGPRDEVKVLHDPEGGRVVRVGRAPPDERRQVEDERTDEERRVLYVALTRARGRLYLPRYPAVFKQLRGCYRLINQRLDELVGGFTPPEIKALFARVEIPCPAPVVPPLPHPAGPVLAAWRPPAALLIDDHPGDAGPEELRAVVAERAGFRVTSYSAVRRHHGVPAVERPPGAVVAAGDPAGYAGATGDPSAAAEAAARADADAALGLDDSAAPALPALPADELPRGRLSGSFLHELLEEVPLGSLLARPPLAAWSARPDIAGAAERLRRRHDRHPEHLPHALRLVHTALTADVRLGDEVMPGLCSARHLVREMEFLYPIPERAHPLLAGPGARPPAPDEHRPAWRVERGLVKGFVDLLFEHQGRVYVCDWKGDWLPTWDPAAVAAHCQQHYDVQAQIYTLAALRLCGIASEAAHQARFGGVLYCLLRGMRPDDPGAGIHFHRPSFAEVQSWEGQMLEAAYWGLSGS